MSFPTRSTRLTDDPRLLLPGRADSVGVFLLRVLFGLFSPNPQTAINLPRVSIAELRDASR